MKIGVIYGILISLLACSGNQPISIDQTDLKSGLSIFNDSNRGVGYTDPLGNQFNLRYIPITISNDTTVAIHVRIDLSNDYESISAFS